MRGVWIFPSHAREKSFRAFCRGFGGDGHLLWGEIPENPEFLNLIQWEKIPWSRCFLWHGWLLALSGTGAHFYWAVGPVPVVANRLDTCLGAYSARIRKEWGQTDGYSTDVARMLLVCSARAWTDGSRVRDDVAGACFGGAGVYAQVSGSAWFPRIWGNQDLLPPDLDSGA